MLWESHRELAWTDSWTQRTCNQCSYRHPAGHRLHLPSTQKHKSHQGNTGSNSAHKAQTCGRLLSAGQPRQRHRNRKSVTASHTWHELRTGSLFDMTAATEPQRPATGWPAATENNLPISWESSAGDPASRNMTHRPRENTSENELKECNIITE